MMYFDHSTYELKALARMADLSLPWDYQLVNGKCEMVNRFDKKDEIPFFSKTRPYPLSYSREDIKNEFISEFLTPKSILSSEFIQKSQKFIQRKIDLNKLFELELSPLSVDFKFKQEADKLQFNQYEEV